VVTYPIVWFPGAPAGYDRRGAEFDRLLMDAIRVNDSEAILGLDPGLIEAAGECGLRPVVIMLGAAQAARLTPEVLSYEGPFGVGYGTAFFGAAEVAPSRRASTLWLRSRAVRSKPTFAQARSSMRRTRRLRVTCPRQPALLFRCIGPGDCGGASVPSGRPGIHLRRGHPQRHRGGDRGPAVQAFDRA